ncbi:MAG: GDP-mannose 4,6-dehydratase [archaeon]|nr:GDP-mannose 4,6-dehydratase [archaeon]
MLITGAAGFLGSWLTDIIVQANGLVDCVDNLSTGKRNNLEHLKDRVNIFFSDVEKFSPAGAQKYDYIFHFSSRASPEEYQEHPVDTLEANSTGTRRMLEVARNCGATLVFASTSEIYGDAQVIPTPETYFGNVNPIGVRSCYDEGKRFGEALCMAFFRSYQLKVRIPRIFNTYGERIREDGIYARALPRFVKQALNDELITIFGDGNQTRSFCYVTDTIKGILKLATHESIDGEVFNIGNPHEITIVSLAAKIIEMTQSKSKITYLPAMPDDPRRRMPDISKAKRVLGWTPEVDLDYGLGRIIDYFRKNS